MQPIEVYIPRFDGLFEGVRRLHALVRRTIELAKAWPRRKKPISFPRGTSFEDRFWGRVDRRGPDECWPWLGGFLKDGYGSVAPSYGRTEQAHRVAYRLSVGPIPEGAYMLHDCDNPACCNPGHLTPGSQAKNMDDASKRGRVWRSLSPADVLAIVAAWKAGEKLARIARSFGVADASIRAIVEGKNHVHITGGPVLRTPAFSQ